MEQVSNHGFIQTFFDPKYKKSSSFKHAADELFLSVSVYGHGKDSGHSVKGSAQQKRICKS